MAKMFYTMEEAKAALGRTEDEIKILSRDGKLREFRDGPRLMFKADQVEALKGSLPPKDGGIDIADSGAPLSLMDSRSGSVSGGSVAGGSVAGGSAAGGSGAMSIKDDTAMGDIGLSGGSRAGSRPGGSASGINIFNTDDAGEADPMAATAITPASEAANMEAVGSGSGLLDLTRESDDTSLGAVLDEISPGKRGPGGSRAGSAAGAAAVTSSTTTTTAVRTAPVVVARPDASAPFFGGLAFGGALISLFALFILSAAVTGAHVNLVPKLVEFGFFIILGIFAVIAIVMGAVGFALGKVLR